MGTDSVGSSSLYVKHQTERPRQRCEPTDCILIIMMQILANKMQIIVFNVCLSVNL